MTAISILQTLAELCLGQGSKLLGCRRLPTGSGAPRVGALAESSW
jgi:hypothetical protein